MGKDKELKRTIEIVIGFNANDEEIEYIKSDFMREEYGYTDPIGYTAKLIQMGLEFHQHVAFPFYLYLPYMFHELQLIQQY